jgi:hypothetical protein
MRHIVTFDSSERDLSVWPNPQDFERAFNTPVYNVSEIAVVAAQIPLSQPTLVNGNRAIPLGAGNPSVFLENDRFISNPVDLAAHVQTVTGLTVTYDTDHRNLVFTGVTAFEFNWETAEYLDGYGPAANLLGFTGADVQATETSPGTWELRSGVVNLTTTVRSLFLRLTHGEDDLTEPVFLNSDHAMFFGRILVDPSQNTLAMKNGEVLVRKLEVNIPTMTSGRLRLYWNNGNRLFQYDLRNSNILIKFAIECDHTKKNTVYEDILDPGKLPPPVDPPLLDFPERVYIRREYKIAAVFAILIMGLGALLMFNGQQRTPGSAASSHPATGGTQA